MKLPIRSREQHTSNASNSDRQRDVDEGETMRERIERVAADLQDLSLFYNIKVSPQRKARLKEHYNEELHGLEDVPFDKLDQQGRVDYLLLNGYLERCSRLIDLETAKDKKIVEPPLSFAVTIIRLCESRQHMLPIDAQAAAEDVHNIIQRVTRLIQDIDAWDQGVDETGILHIDQTSAYRAACTVEQLQEHLAEWFEYYNGYDSMFTQWLVNTYGKVKVALEKYANVFRAKLAGIVSGDGDAIIGDPIGRDGLLVELKYEHISYTPEELLNIGEKEYEWCLKEMKNLHLTSIMDMTWRMFMMTPARQKVNPFFLGGDDIIVSYPTSTMDHEDKLMSMRGNNPHFSRSIVFHELLPGHHLQTYHMPRSKPYRYPIFDTPFSNRIGMLFWRIHRCIRIVFSLRFHLGQSTPQECIDMLVDRVGHERATAEGEVRRSLIGDYSQLYQAGYLLGGLQLYKLRQELVGSGEMPEKSFHDRFLKENTMPIEMLRALITKQPLERDFETNWRFYQKI
ncbi:X-Pro dipeptidyl-peptidase [Calycina marina]|uniref:X-Pro dipeptidyl-peptidase n=1 Tax=Calycina marina TaxID=1763456 RepID=A0A9P7Z676_9HELO|nr:X-Pro dipeptidyl-peptidase [Calycina marina]